MSSPEKWSSAEDELIATLIRQYGSDWLEKYALLLSLFGKFLLVNYLVTNVCFPQNDTRKFGEDTDI